MTSIARAGMHKAQPPATAVQRFEAIVLAFRKAEAGVERVKLFGYDCLRFGGKVFAKIDKDRLVMKLPKPRIEALMRAGQLEPYDGKRGTMKEWVVVDAADERLAIRLANEARAFAAR